MWATDGRSAAVSLAHANQLPLPRLYSASGSESDSCKKRYSKYWTFTFTFYSGGWGLEIMLFIYVTLNPSMTTTMMTVNRDLKNIVTHFTYLLQQQQHLAIIRQNH